jgi:DNA (cytosine-5)-methyltransferase 1
VERLLGPADTIRAADRLRVVLGADPFSARLAKVLDAAEWYEQDPASNHFETAEAMASNPFVSSAVSQVAALVACPGESPTMVTSGVLRVVARFAGSDVDTVNRGTDGRVAVARLIGGSVFDSDVDVPRFAHLALVEIAVRRCVPRQPRCSSCPLRAGCRYAESNPPAVGLT